MLKIPLHHCPYASKAPAPFFSNFYMTLVSIVQGFAIGILFENFLDKFDYYNFETYVTIPRYIVSFLCFSLVWHKFINSLQYNAWTLTYQDTMLVMGFAFMEAALIAFSSNSVNDHYNFVGLYYMFYSFTFISAIMGYDRAGKEMSKVYNKLLVLRHFKQCKSQDKCGDQSFAILLEYNKRSAALCKKFGLISIIFAVPLFFLANTNAYSDLSGNTRLLLEIAYAIPGIGLYLAFIVKLDIRNIILKWDQYLLTCRNKEVISELTDS
ncbi:MAG: hypothetical protein KAH48_03400 [Chlorobi bacterium]|nr:hypothetical protein [Chlorobiota bacterium]